MDDLLDKIKEIKELTTYISGCGSKEDETIIAQIQRICDSILIDDQINQRLKSETRHLEPDSLS